MAIIEVSGHVLIVLWKFSFITQPSFLSDVWCFLRVFLKLFCINLPASFHKTVACVF